MTFALLDLPAPVTRSAKLTEDDAVDIWIARWLRIRTKDLVRRYGCDPRRLYEIWEESRFPESRMKALAVLGEKFPGLERRIDPGPHRRIPSRGIDPAQLSLFEDPSGCRSSSSSH